MILCRDYLFPPNYMEILVFQIVPNLSHYVPLTFFRDFAKVRLTQKSVLSNRDVVSAHEVVFNESNDIALALFSKFLNWAGITNFRFFAIGYREGYCAD